MKSPLLLLVFGLVLWSACNNSGNNPAGSKTGTGKKMSHCYASINNRDTVMFRMVVSDNIVTGELSYNYFEKDKSQGTIVGEMIGDTLIADYKFSSEGMQSERELVFLKNGNNLMEGYGDIEQQNGKIRFKDRKTLNYADNMILKQVDCK